MASSSSGLYAGGERGAGGKLRRERKPPPTPYDRPPRTNTGWISRIVDPAKRIISGGATRLLPSFFSPLPPISDSPNRDDGLIETEQEAADHNASDSVDLLVPKSSGGVDPSEAKGKSKLHIYDKDRQDIGDYSDGQQLDIEQLIKGKTFSREEIDRLMAILRSRVVDAEQEKQLPSMSRAEEAQRTEKLHEKQNAPIDEKEELDKFKWTSPLSQPTACQAMGLCELVRSVRLSSSLSKVQGAIGASPVDIARAYMGSRTAEVSLTPIGSISKSEKFPLTNEFSAKPFMTSPSKAPICWPGAITQDQEDYSTPQSQNSRYGLQSFPRTPYSRTTYTKSKSRLNPLRHDSERFLSISSVPLQPTRTPMYGKSISSMAEGSYGSGGPMRRMRNKLTSATPTRESALSHTTSRSPWTKESNLDLFFKKNYEPATFSTPNVKAVDSKPQNSEVGVSSVHPHSSKLARQILEQLDRPITLKEKSEELKLAVSWKNLSHSTSSPPIQSNSNRGIFGVGSSKTTVVDAVLSAQANGGNNVLDRTDAVSGAGKGALPASLDKTSNVSSTNIWSSQSIQKLDSQTKIPDQVINSSQPKGNGQSWFLGSNQSKGLDVSNNSSGPEPQNMQRKPVLPSISIGKPGLKPSFASETNVGFTFPVTTKSSTFAEPPTPSIMPSSSTSPPQEPQQSKVSATPTFTFGNKITIAPPVNPSSSASTASIHNDVSAPKFKFGSGKTRLSFALAGTDAVSAPDDAGGIPEYKFGSGEKRLNFGSIESDAVCY